MPVGHGFLHILLLHLMAHATAVGRYHYKGRTALYVTIERKFGGAPLLAEKEKEMQHVRVQLVCNCCCCLLLLFDYYRQFLEA